MKTALLIAAMPAAASAFSLRPAAGPFSSSTPSFEQTVVDFSSSQSPPKDSPHHRSGRRGTRLMLFRRNRSNKYQLQASTVSPDDHRNSNPWFDFVNLRESVADYADSLFSLEGGVAAAATRPYMPNLEVEEQFLTTESTTTETASVASSSSSVTELDKGELLMELQTLSDSFDELQSTFENTINNLHDENSFLEEGIKMLTATIDEQAAEIEQLQKQQTLGGVVGEESDDLDGIGALFEDKVVADDTELLAQVQNKAETLEKDNEMLRQRVRALEVELSDIAFESRKFVSSAAAVEDAAAAVMEAVAPTTSGVNAAAVVEDIKAAPSEDMADGVIIEETYAASEVAKLSPHAPSTPIPQHILQQKEIDYLRMQVREYEAERKSVRKLFSRGIRRGAKKVGKVLNLWRPIYLILWGEIRGDGKMAL